MPDDFNISITVQDTMNISIVKQDEINVAVSTPLVLGLVATPVLSAIDLPTSKVTITCATDGATIYYTIDGSVPTEDDTEYTVPIYVSETTTIRANAFKTSYMTSNVGSETYTITNFFVNDQSSLDTTTFTITGTNGKTLYMNHGDGNITTINMDGAGHNYDIDYGVGNEGSYNVSFSGDLDEIKLFTCSESSISGDGEWVGVQMLALTYLNFTLSNISGNINTFSSIISLTQFRVGRTLWSGDFISLVTLTNLIFVSIQESNVDTYTQGALPASWDVCDIYLLGNEWSTQMVDDFVGDLDNSSVSVTNKTLNIGGNNSAPSATGKEAILSLVQKGRTVIASTLQEHGIVTQADIQQSLADGVAFLNLETLGSTLWDASPADDFASGTGSWVKEGANTIANVAGELEITYVDDEHGARVYLADSSILSTDLTVGATYRLEADAYYTGGSAGSVLQIRDGVSNHPTAALTGSKTRYTIYFVAYHAQNCRLSSALMSADNVVYIDNLSIQLVSDSLIPYAGADSGDTPYFVELKNQQGEDFINGFIGAQGGGEAYGAEEVTDGDVESAIPTINGQSIDNVLTTMSQSTNFKRGGTYSLLGTPNAGKYPRWRFQNGIPLGTTNEALYYKECYVYLDTATGVTEVQLIITHEGLNVILDSTTVKDGWVRLKGYFTNDTTNTNKVFYLIGSGNDKLLYSDDHSLKLVTDCSANGVHIISAKDGAVRNWASKDANYNRNDTEYAWAIYSS